MSDDEGGELSAGLRPAPLWEPLPPEGIQRHTAEQMIESFVPVPMLDLDARSCAADGRPTGGRAQALRQLGAQAGYRRAQDLTGRHPAAYGPL